MDGLLESFTADLGITPKQLAEACSQSSTLGESHQVGACSYVKVSIILTTIQNSIPEVISTIVRGTFLCGQMYAFWVEV